MGGCCAGKTVRWSGVCIQRSCRERETRWLSLPIRWSSSRASTMCILLRTETRMSLPSHYRCWMVCSICPCVIGMSGATTPTSGRWLCARWEIHWLPRSILIQPLLYSFQARKNCFGLRRPWKGRETAEYLFRVIRPAEVHVYAVGEIGQERMDFGWIEEVSSGERVWDMRRENTVPAGGWEVNRLFDGTVSLPPGFYRAVFRTDPRQDYGDWVRNPPFDPAGWGVSLFTTVPEAVQPVDPWEDQEAFIRINRVGDSERHIARFRVHAPVWIAVYALGEMGDEDRYDYARITAGRSERVVWENDVGPLLACGRLQQPSRVGFSGYAAGHIHGNLPNRRFTFVLRVVAWRTRSSGKMGRYAVPCR